MKTKNYLFIIVLMLVSFTSINAQLLLKKQVFTVNSKAQLDFRKIGMSEILFYLDDVIYLKRIILATDTAGANREKGNVVFENGKAYAYKKFTSSATGKSDTMINNRIMVKFENKPDSYFTFKKKKGKYDTEEKYYLVLNKGNKTVNYGGATWEIIMGTNTYLFWKPKVKNKKKKTKDKVRGLKNDGTEKKTIKDRIKGE